MEILWLLGGFGVAVVLLIGGMYVAGQLFCGIWDGIDDLFRGKRK